MLSLPLSGRMNIMNWLETFRNSGKGLNQKTLNLFDKGNNYTSNERITTFNKHVKIVVDAFKANNIEVKKTPKGRFSITAKMLKQLTLENFTDELYDFVFDETLSEINFDDKNVVKILDKLYSEGKIHDFFQLSYFKAFAEYNNIPALEWLVKTFGIEYYSFKNNIISDILFKTKYEDDILDFYIKVGILENTDLLEQTRLFKMIVDLKKESLKKILPLIRIENTESAKYGVEMLNSYFDIDKDLIGFFKFTDTEWKRLATEFTKEIETKNEFDYYLELLKLLVNTTPIFSLTLMNLKDWKMYKEFLTLVPLLRDIFIF